MGRFWRFIYVTSDVDIRTKLSKLSSIVALILIGFAVVGLLYAFGSVLIDEIFGYNYN